MNVPRPAFNVRLLSDRLNSPLNGSEAEVEAGRWIVAGTADAPFGREAWNQAVEQLILHPEYSSSSILRADVEEDVREGDATVSAPRIHKHECRRLIRRTLLPRRPNLDRSLAQDCFIYDANNSAIVLLQHTVATTQREDVPYYHPQVRSLAFRFVAVPGESPSVEVHILPFEEDNNFDAAANPQHRLSRTIIALLALQCKLAWGSEKGYKKRVEHDVLVPKADYQALYMRLRSRYAKQLIDNWAESTDPGKHVFEDLGIAAFIMLLWRDTFPELEDGHWGRPTTFLDVGCGNGLLVYLLTCEGYSGFGIDLQVRKSWTVYARMNSKVDLRVDALQPFDIITQEHSPIPEQCFLIGNHADELTPWLPLLASCSKQSQGFVNIPCCRYQLDGMIFGATKYEIDYEAILDLVGGDELYRDTIAQLARGPPAERDTRSRNVAFLRYIDHLHLQAGWQIEKEALRIPSTKNWAIAGRRRVWEGKVDEEVATETRAAVNARVMQLATHHGRAWQARSFTTPTGKPDH